MEGYVTINDTRRMDWLERTAMELPISIQTGPDGFELHLGRVILRDGSDLRALIDEGIKVTGL